MARLKEKGKLYHLNDQAHLANRDVILDTPDSKQLNPQEKMISNETKQLLENAIDSIDAKYRIVYVMKQVEELSLKEIAQALDLTVANVKVRLHMSKEMLKEKLYEVTNDKDVFEFGFSRCDRITENVMKLI